MPAGRANACPGDVCPFQVVVIVSFACAGASITATTMAAAPPAPLTYYNGDHWDPAAASSDKGFALLALAQAIVTITTSWNGHTSPGLAFALPAGTLTLAVVSPYATGP